MKTIKAAISLLTVVILTSQVLAQNSNVDTLFDMDLAEIFEVKVVSGTRSDKSIKDLPMRVWVITEQDIRTNNYTSLTQALEDAPNIKVSRPGNGIQGETFLMRGLFGNYYVKFLLDDVPINPVVMSGFPISEQINMRNVERIEVLYGPAAAIYGSDAVAGVINIITKKPKDNETKVIAKGGANYGYGNVFGSYGLGEKKSSPRLDLYGLYSQRDDWDIYDNYRDYLNPINYPQGDLNPDAGFGDIEARAWSAGVKFRFEGLTLNYDIFYRRENSSIGQFPSFYFYDDPDAIWGETIQRGVIRYDTTLSDVSLSSRLTYLRSRLDPDSYFSFIFPTLDPSTFGQRNRAFKYQASDEIMFEEIANWNPSEALEFTAGFQGSYMGQLPKTGDLPEPFDESRYDPFATEVSSANASSVFGDFGFNPKTVNQWGVFGQALYTHGDFVTLAGVRYDRNSRFGSSINPRIGARYNADESLSFNINYGHAFKAPSPYFEFNSVAGLNPDGSINYLAIPAEEGLQPEEFKSLEIGASKIWSRNLTTEINLFFNKLDNLILDTAVPIDPARYPNSGATESAAFANSGDSQVRYWGGDLVVRARNIVPAIGLGADLFITYTDGEETFPRNAGTIDGILNQPEWTGKLRLSSSPVENLTLGLDNQWFSDWNYRGLISKEDFETNPNSRIKGDFLMDFYATYQASQTVTVFFEVENLLDQDNFGIEAFRGATLPGNPQQGRNLFAGFELRFR